MTENETNEIQRERQKRNLQIYYLFTALGILALIVVFSVLRLFSQDSDYSEIENRNLQTRPAFTVNQLTSGRYTESFETYVEDQFPFRTIWIQVKSLTDRVLGKTDSNDIFLGTDGYLIENFTEPSEEDYVSLLQGITSFGENHGDLKQYMLVAPTAVSVYEEKLPAFAVAGDEDAYLNRLSEDAESVGITFIDVRGKLEDAGEDTQLYYRTDHHWTTDAAYLASQCFLDADGKNGGSVEYDRLQVSSSFSGTLTASSGFRMNETDNIYVYLPKAGGVSYSVKYVEEAETEASLYKTENLEARDQYTLFMNGNHPLVKIETTAENEDVLLILKDSYANCLIPFLTEHYRKILVVDPRYYYDNLDDLIASENVTEILYLYNAVTLASDTSLETVIGSGEMQ